MNKKQRFLVLFLIVVSLLIILLVGYSIYLSSISKKSLTTATDLISYPPSYTVNSYATPISYSDFNNEFYKEYVSDQISISPYPTVFSNNSDFKHNLNFSLYYKQLSHIDFILVDASNIKTSKELYEKMYVALSPTGLLVQYSEQKIGNLTLSLSVMDEALGGGAYVLNGAVKNGNKGYFFKVLVEDKVSHTLNNNEILQVLSFNYVKVPSDYLKIIKKLVSEDIPQDRFKPFEIKWSGSLINALKESNKGKFPSTF